MGGLAAAVVLGTALVVVPCVVTLSGEPVSSERVADDAQTRYPIVLAHGIMGFAYVGKQSYWRDIPETLRAHGAQVFVTQVSAFNSSDVRGQQLLDQVQKIMQETGAKKVNLIGHSHGSHSVRYVAGTHPEWVASVTTVSGPTTGSEVADWLAELDRNHPWVAGLVLSFGDAVGGLINSITHVDLPIDSRQAMQSLTSTGAGFFNQRFPAGVPEQACGEGGNVVDGVRYYSWSSVGQFYRALNLSDYIMSFTGKAFVREPDNDGLVGKCASHLGQVIRDDYPMNHFQIVNQFSGLVAPGADPIGLFVEHARRLKEAGL
ncbi:MAG TPA: triacylglycerol lipase [Aquabacterium sp.]|uniref:lipase family alpha/beta hydrolase n=1 Tax=Aquabacterium sp. TaxID=1872578 RepID=UPI002E333A44|nr:triacylglycerol lipase [Aquabacterium sp.]HEX5357769.1 triacylglycerol lipase [Aquabacterium sp.]